MRKATVFISWSEKDSPSYKLAEFLRGWLHHIIKNINIYVSSKDVGAGEPWLFSILDALRKSTFGILCLSKKSLQSKWILFESGATARSFHKHLVCPILIDLSPSEVPYPLSIFQSVQATKEGIFGLLVSINNNMPNPISQNQLKGNFDENWQKCESFLSKLQSHQHKSFWNVLTRGMKPEERIYIVLSAKWGVDYENGKPTKKRGHTVQVSYNEAVAFPQFQDALKDTGHNIKLVYGGIRDFKIDRVNRPDFSDDGTLIILGSKHANDLCRRILSSDQLKSIPFRYEMTKNKKEKCIKVYQDDKGIYYNRAIESYPSTQRRNEDSKNDGNRTLNLDYGIILRATNPLDRGCLRKVLILGGNHGFGTESAIKFITDVSNCNALHDMVCDYDFELLFEASVGRDIGLKLGILKLCLFNNGKWSPINIRQLRKLRGRLW